MEGVDGPDVPRQSLPPQLTDLRALSAQLHAWRRPLPPGLTVLRLTLRRKPALERREVVQLAGALPHLRRLELVWWGNYRFINVTRLLPALPPQLTALKLTAQHTASFELPRSLTALSGLREFGIRAGKEFTPGPRSEWMPGEWPPALRDLKACTRLELLGLREEAFYPRVTEAVAQHITLICNTTSSAGLRELLAPVLAIGQHVGIRWEAASVLRDLPELEVLVLSDEVAVAELSEDHVGECHGEDHGLLQGCNDKECNRGFMAGLHAYQKARGRKQVRLETRKDVPRPDWHALDTEAAGIKFSRCRMLPDPQLPGRRF